MVRRGPRDVISTTGNGLKREQSSRSIRRLIASSSSNTQNSLALPSVRRNDSSRSFVDEPEDDWTLSKEEECCPMCKRSFARPVDPDYFVWLDRLTRKLARTPLPSITATRSSQHDDNLPEAKSSLPEALFNQGYFERFFRIIRLLGRGGSGAVWLVEHRLDEPDGEEEPLGVFAVKIVPIGTF